MPLKLKPLHPTPEPGSALRSLRKKKHLTLAEVSTRTGLPVSTLSKIETGKMSLSYDKLARLSAGLEVDIAQLFEPDAALPAMVQGRRSITRSGGGLVVETENYSHLYPGADLLNKRLVPIIAEPHARSLAEFGELVRHPGEEFVYVLEGTVDLHTDLYTPARLEAGDSMYFDSGMGHAYIAVGLKRCRVLSICTSTQSQLIEAVGADQGKSSKAPKHASTPPIASGKKRQGLRAK
ncbi:MAG TPA: XRE family transcriptional regulator [Rhodanobacter sp.]|jgi:transcriptional regulator with XRE-family HTH domain|nr:XRE family transcriptional regulator [Rhodanobacter sp.]